MVSRWLTRCTLFAALLVAGWAGSWAPSASAQTIGTFRFQLQPFCNVVSVSIVQVGPVFALDGFDDQCGVESRSSVVGTAFFNLDGSVGIGLTLISVPGGRPIHIGVALSTATLQGPWWDSAGNLGTFVFTPGGGTGGNLRPFVGGIGAAAIDPTQVQRRVTGACAAGSVVRVINEDGTVGCEVGGGDISSVSAGLGLSGGATSGPATLAVAFAGPGAAATAARSDHQHQLPGSNTAVGQEALADNTSGQHNVAAGFGALSFNTTGARNTAVGASALTSNTTGSFNTAIGNLTGALLAGSSNTFVGYSATSDANLQNASAIGARAQVSSQNSMVLGSIAGINGATSNVNVGIGTTTPNYPLQVVSANGTGRIGVGRSGDLWSAGDQRIVSFGDNTFVYVGEEDADDRLVLTGSSGVRFKTSAFQSVAPDPDNAIPLGGPSNRWTAVFAVNGAIQTSDARWKTNIADLDYGLTALLRLHPVSFTWKDRDAGQVNLGLLAQEVEQVIPEAVVHGASREEPLGMNYSSLIPVLIKAIQEQETALRVRDARIEELAAQVAALRDQITAAYSAMRR